ncbi:MAG: hypothetical protein ACTHKG_15860 [Nocardioides sp.]
MSDVDNARARAEAMNEPVGRALRSARRAQLWAGLNRYLASEAVHAHHAKEAEDKASEAEAKTSEAEDEKPPLDTGEPE